MTRLILKHIVAGLFGLFAFFSPLSAFSKERLNVLFVAVDDLRPELGCYGKKEILSPHIDRLAARGVLFARAYVQQSVCNPSRVSILSGLRPDSTAILTNSHKLIEKHPDVVPLPRHFKNNGYHTVSLGKIYHHPDDDPGAWSEPVWRPFGIPQGWRNYRRPENLSLVRDLHAQLPEKKRESTPLGRVKGPPHESLDIADNVYPDGLTADMAIHALGRLSEHHEPFFLAVGFYKPHLPFACPRKYWDLYDRDQIDLPQNDRSPEAMPAVAFMDSIEMRQYHGFPREGRVSEGEARKLIHGYRACVSYMDAQLGRVLDELERLGLSENTIVILWGDHGWHLREQGIWGKQTNFENATRIPLIVRSPAHEEKRRVAAPSAPPAPDSRATSGLVEAVDIYPTLCELAGLPLPGHLEGTSFAALIEQPDRPWKTAAFSQSPRPINRPHRWMGRSIRTDRFRFTRWESFDGSGEIAGLELYDHENDPAESINLADNPAYKDRVADLTKRLSSGWRSAASKLPPSSKENRSPQ